jgi:hypothetical protein
MYHTAVYTQLYSKTASTAATPPAPVRCALAASALAPARASVRPGPRLPAACMVTEEGSAHAGHREKGVRLAQKMQVGCPKDASWPMHFGGNTAVKGWSWPILGLGHGRGGGVSARRPRSLRGARRALTMGVADTHHYWCSSSGRAMRCSHMRMVFSPALAAAVSSVCTDCRDGAARSRRL